MTLDPQNHAVAMTEAGIKKMIRDAMKPLTEDNRKLRFMVGMSAGLFAHKAEVPYEDVLDSWMAIAASHLTAMPETIPTELVMMAGKEYAKNEIEALESETENGVGRPTVEALQRLETTMEDLRSELDAWFCSQYGEMFVRRFQYQEKLHEFNASSHDDSLLISTAWNGLVKLNKFAETGWDAYDHSARWGVKDE